MANILYLVHRLPFPPNKGDKVRSYHLLKHLLKSHRVFLGTFIDDPDDWQYVAELQALCPDQCVIPLDPRRAKLRSLNGLLAGEALTLRYYRDARLQNWVDTICRQHKINAAVIFSSAMAQYVEDQSRLPTLVDFVDVDSVKWAQYAPRHRWPMSWIYQRESQQLLAYERQIAAQSARSFFVTDAEVDLFNRLAPECSIRVQSINNGVDADFFSPAADRPTPYLSDETPLVFTGAMDYWPNIDAARWFAAEVLPSLLMEHPTIRFHIVGRNPTPEVLALANEHVVVSGTVPDIRPYLQHARIIVAPLRVARGIQNKILEAMAMAMPVVATSECAHAVDAKNGSELESVDNAQEFGQAISKLLAEPKRAANLGAAARQFVLNRYSWDAHLSKLDNFLAFSPSP